jgi:hypothetical protein
MLVYKDYNCVIASCSCLYNIFCFSYYLHAISKYEGEGGPMEQFVSLDVDALYL